ncbi:28S ribosomal protein S17, mitochondrial [Armadillidium nasatum]|uniref:28S ribosomal protein S17, mitochondrial n=1 Tax=Armadillidium nasatum TaxID=96803 RepID=A0A5N5SUU6_9CRUS|nr:28S ribosomal protein S17, mitochondrial [Armadillidium nasatum]
MVYLKVKNLLLIGQCIAHNAPSATRVQIKMQDFNSFLKLYFGKHVLLYAHDPEQKCKDGDIVLIRKREEPLTKYITHDLVKIVYKYGDITCPITGEKVVGDTYRKTMALTKELYGVAEDGTGGFDYDSAPERGWQEDRKDFSHRVTYKKYHEFEPGHPLHNDPTAIP